jgi:hypothetical protein
MKIHVKRERLTDRSHVYNVLLTQDGSTIRLPAVNQASAEALADSMYTDINAGTTEEVDAVTFNY